MAKEIERKFRLAGIPAWLAARGGEEIEQAYLAVDESSEVRLRRGEKLTLTVKRGRSESRDELEVILDRELFDRLWTVAAGRELRKRRIVVGLDDGLQAEVDVYAGRLDGLVVAEVEFGSEAESGAFESPSWFGAEVTGDDRYANHSLALATGPPEIGGGEDGNLERVDSSYDEHGPSRAYRLKKKEAPRDGVRRIAAGRLEKAIDRLREAARGEEVAESIHGARKDLKKLRALLRLVRDRLGDERYRAENERFRAAGRALSETRDFQVKGEALAELLDGSQLEASARIAAEAWGRALEEEGEAASARVLGDGSATIGQALELLEDAGSTEDWQLGRKDSWSLVAPGLERAYRRGRRAMREAGEGDAEAVHSWRKRTKDLWYHQRLLRPLWPEAMEAAAGWSHELADLLGDHHDLTLLAGDLGDRDLPRPEAIELEAALRARQDRLLGDALFLGGRIYAEKPKAFCRRIHRYWKLWDRSRA